MRCSGGLGDLGVAFPARSYHAEQMPGHPAVSLACGFLVRSLLKDAIRGAQQKPQARKIAGCSGHAGEGGGESSSPKPTW